MKNKFLNIKNVADNKAEIYIYGDIVSSDWEKWGTDDVCPADIKEAIDKIGNRDIDIHIYSAGGSVFAGEAIRAMLTRLSGHKTVYVEGLAASIASVIAMCYDELHISAGSYMMIHNPSAAAWGTSKDLRATADTLDIIKETIIDAYKTKLVDDFDVEKLPEMLDNETWLTANDIKDMFVEVVIDGQKNITAKIDNNMLKCLNKVPEDLILPKQEQADLKALKDAIECEKIANELKLLR